MIQVVADRSERLLLLVPIFCEISLASRSRRHSLENRSRHGFQLRFARAHHVNHYAGRLRQFGNVFRWNHAGVIRPIGENHDDFSSGVLRGIFYGQQQTVVESCIISGDGGANRPLDIRAVCRQRRVASQIAAVRVERNPVDVLQRAHEVSDRILREHKTSIHVIAGVKQDEHIGAGQGRIQRAEGAVAGKIIGQNRQVNLQADL